jgi:hypothetical protein
VREVAEAQPGDDGRDAAKSARAVVTEVAIAGTLILSAAMNSFAFVSQTARVTRPASRCEAEIAVGLDNNRNSPMIRARVRHYEIALTYCAVTIKGGF